MLAETSFEANAESRCRARHDAQWVSRRRYRSITKPLGGKCRERYRTYRWCAGKTTLLRNLLENTKLKIGCIVNDVASVNVDAKLIRNDRTRDRASSINTTTDLADTIELANGCACECFCVLPRRAISSKKPSALLCPLCRLQHC